jgi:hypothetical protein
MFIVVLRRSRSINGRFGNDDLLVWADSVNVRRMEDGWSITCNQRGANENDDKTGPTYTVKHGQDGTWEHFFVKDARNNRLVWSTAGNSRPE